MISKYGCILAFIYIEVTKKKEENHHRKLNQYQRLKKEYVLYPVVVYHNDDTIM